MSTSQAIVPRSLAALSWFAPYYSATIGRFGCSHVDRGLCDLGQRRILRLLKMSSAYDT